MFRHKIKDFDDKEETIKKKDEQLEERQSNLMDLMSKNIETTIEFKQVVGELKSTIKSIEDNHRNDHNTLFVKLNDDHEYFKHEISEVRTILSK